MPLSKRSLGCRFGGLALAVCACVIVCAAFAGGGVLSAAKEAAPIELVLPDLDGHPYDLADLKGRVVLVNFWASWCTPCMEEMPSIQRLADAMRNQPFAVVGVNVAEGLLRVRAAVKRLGIGFPVLLDKDSAVFKKWDATVLPTTYVLDGEGVIRYVGRGPLEWDGVQVIELLKGLVEEVSEPAAEPAE